MKITVDRNRCRGVSNCASVAPNVFEIDEQFRAVILDPQGDSDQDILKAAMVCPTKAIILQDENSGKRIFPLEEG